MTSAHTVHLVVPCFRESQRIPSFLAELVREMDRLGGVAVLVVDDGSGATEVTRMKAVVDELRPKFLCLRPLLALPENVGKGGAVYASWAAHEMQDWLMFVDADGSVTASEVSRLIAHVRSNNTTAQAFFGSRVKMLGRKVDRLLQRHLMGRIFATLVSEMLDVAVYDSQCGLKMVERNLFSRVQPQLQTRGFAFDVELMVSVLDSGGSIEEFPIDWHETPGGKVRLLVDSWGMLLEILAIKKRRGRVASV
ncbi:glycosyltransferase [Phragmitibacter flavus]|uniref:Glycosyltransferase n=1 Tax=Phragmitibacter flavus TaxID=2576071 RepID=A0A5R8KCA9_9BACT|nr:glycosyltransferase [Phragmitibacter flavus]TLD69936.1 glycosyltransferase [Phragmitibacter flavus]